MKDFSAFLQKQCEKYKSEANDKISLAMVCSSLDQLLFYRCVRTVTHHLPSVSFILPMCQNRHTSSFAKNERTTLSSPVYRK